jgi:hypothetical protein
MCVTKLNSFSETIDCYCQKGIICISIFKGKMTSNKTSRQVMQITINVLQKSKQLYTYLFEPEENLVNVAESICWAEIKQEYGKRSLKEPLPRSLLISMAQSSCSVQILCFWKHPSSCFYLTYRPVFMLPYRWKKYAAFTQVLKQSVLRQLTNVTVFNFLKQTPVPMEHWLKWSDWL